MDKVHVTISQELQDFSITADTSSLLRGNLYSTNTARQLDDEDEVLEEAKEEQEIYGEIFNITENTITPEKEEETREDLKIKIERFRIIRENKEKLYDLL